MSAEGPRPDDGHRRGLYAAADGCHDNGPARPLRRGRTSWCSSPPTCPTTSCWSTSSPSSTCAATKLPKIGGGGHWAVPELLNVAGAENLEGVMVGLANWPGKRQADLREALHRTHRRTVVRPRLDLRLRPRHDPEGGAGTQPASPTARKVNEAIRALDMTDGPALFFPDGRLKYDEQGPPRRCQAVRGAMARRQAGAGLSAIDCHRRRGLAEGLIREAEHGTRFTASRWIWSRGGTGCRDARSKLNWQRLGAPVMPPPAHPCWRR